MSAQDLSTLLWRERELLSMVLFRLEEQNLLLQAGKSRWFHLAAQEVDQTLCQLRTAAFARTVEASKVALDWGAPDEASLQVLASHAPEGPWAGLYTEHLAELTALADDIVALAAQMRKTHAATDVISRETFSGFEPDHASYSSHDAVGRPEE